jgi:hypothetical protein
MLLAKSSLVLSTISAKHDQNNTVISQDSFPGTSIYGYDTAFRYLLQCIQLYLFLKFCVGRQV